MAARFLVQALEDQGSDSIHHRSPPAVALDDKFRVQIHDQVCWAQVESFP